MKKNDLFLDILKGKRLRKLSFVRGLLSIPISGNDFINIVDDKYVINLENDIVEIKTDITKPLFDLNTSITLPSGCMKIVKEDIDTTIGRAIVNYLIIEYGLSGYGEYINKEFDFRYVENTIILPAIEKGDLTMVDYKKSIDTVTFLKALSELVVVAVTEKGIFPPDGLKELKKKTQKEFKDKYGEDWIKDRKISLEYEDKLVKYYMEYIKDDPTTGITTDKKMIKSIKARMVGIGLIDSIDGKENEYILESLSDGTPKDRKKLTSIINNIINGSFNRSTSIQVGGVISKVLTRSTHNYNVVGDDCGVKYGMDINVTDKNKTSLVGRYLTSGKLITEKDTQSIVGRNIEIRSLIYCKSNGDTFCKKCAGIKLAKTKGSILLIALQIGGALVKYYLSIFHNKDTGIVNIDKKLLF